ncbi:MAG: hypothetical protein GTO18_04770 [Anaerolineales bacterium]|nr:hypothetical protein [Anaerolineales bacterium]
MTRAQFILQVAPSAGMAGVLTIIGLVLSAGSVTGSFLLPIVIVGVIVFVAMITFRDASGWNLGLLLVFALIVGLLLGNFFPSLTALHWILALLIAAAIMLMAAGLGTQLGGGVRLLGIALWIGSWIYILGWVVIALFHFPKPVVLLWGMVGLIVFSGLSTVWFASIAGILNPFMGTSLAIDLFILGLNLCIAVVVILYGIHS